jgi:glycosyltransferase involved in cell wall biosynthesis
MYGLKSGKYTDPKYGIKVKSKIVNVIVTHVPLVQTVEYAVNSNQKKHTRVYYYENKLESIKFNLACHKHYKAGADYEIVIVDNESRDKATQEYLELLEKEGIKVLRRENIGFSFAGFKYAWDKFKNDYDYFLFNEQDGVPAKDDWLVEILNKFHSEKDIGAVGNNVESFDLTWEFPELKNLCPYIGERNTIYNLDGFMTFTSSTVLREVDKIGGLFTLPVRGRKNAERNELIFQQPILELGYKIVSFHDGNHLCYSDFYYPDEDSEYKNMPLENVTPMVLADTRLFVFKNYFNWYTA